MNATIEYTKTNTPKDLFSSKEQYLSAIKAWKDYVNSPDDNSLSSCHYLFYSCIRGKDWRKCFGACTNKNKLEHGHKPHQGAYNALQDLKQRIKYSQDSLLKPFGNTISKELLNELDKYLPSLVDLNEGNILPSFIYREVK